VAIRSTARDDVYVVLAGTGPGDDAAFQVFVNPLVTWIWAGAALLVLGVLLGNLGGPPAERLRAAAGLPVPADVLARDVAQPYQPSAGVEDAWLAVYRDTGRHWDLYELAEELVDLEDSFQQWRFRHVKTVERIIGHKRGTGGTAGVGYLRQALDIVFFPELLEVRTLL